MKQSRTLIAVLLLLLPLAAPAQEPAAADPLKLSFDQARQKYEAGDFQAVVGLLEPFKAEPSLPPPFYAVLGGAYIELGRFAEAQALLDPVAAGDAAGAPLLFNAARAAFALKQEDKAEEYLRRAVDKAPQSIAARALGLRYGRQGKVLEAYKLLRPWANAYPGDQEARLAAAFCALELGRGSEAETLLSDLPQDHPQVRVLWARLLLSKGDPHGAISMLSPLAAAPPAEVEHDLRWTLGEARVQIGEAAAAVELLEGHTGDDPDLALLLAQAHQQTGSPEKVLATLKPFVDRLPDPAGAEAARMEPAALALHAAIALEHARALVAGGRWTEAVTVLEKAAALDGSNPAIWQVYGQALAGAGRREEAQKALATFQERAKAAPVKDRSGTGDDPTAGALAEAGRLAAEGQGDRALEVIRRERDIAADDLRPRMMEVHLLLTLKRFAEALQAAEETLALAPGNADAHYQRGVVNLALNKRTEAERDFRQALSILPDHLAALNDLAVLLIAEGRKPEARELLQKVLALKPDDAMARANLQSLESQ